MVFEVGKSYKICDSHSEYYDDAEITNIDDNFIKFNYKSDGIKRIKILNKNEIKSATILRNENGHTIWYWGLFEGEFFNTPRYGIKKASLSDDEIEMNVADGVTIFSKKEDAKKYLFNKILLKEVKSEYYVFENDNCALYESSCFWNGALAKEFDEFKKTRTN